MSNWTSIEIEDGFCYWTGSRMIFHQCAANNEYRERCGGDAMYVVSRTSALTGNRYTDHMCARHAKGWGELPAAKAVGAGDVLGK